MSKTQRFWRQILRKNTANSQIDRIRRDQIKGKQIRDGPRNWWRDYIE